MHEIQQLTLGIWIVLIVVLLLCGFWSLWKLVKGDYDYTATPDRDRRRVPQDVGF